MIRRSSLVLGLLVVLVLAATLPLRSMRPDFSTAPFFPDADAHSRLVAGALSSSPMAGLVFLDIACIDSTDLPGVASRAASLIPQHLLKPLDLSMRKVPPRSLLALWASWFDDEEETCLEALMHPGAIEAILEKNLRLLRTPAGSMAIPWVRTDPLELRMGLLARLPHTAGIAPNSDPRWQVSSDGRHALFILRPEGGQADAGQARAIAAALDALAGQLEGCAVVTFSGGPLYTAANASSIRTDIGRILVFSLAGFALVYLCFVRSRGALWILVTPALATLLAASGTALAWPEISGLALGFGASLMGLSEDYSVHVHYAMRSSGDGPCVVRKLWKPLFHSWLLNSAGFAVLLFSGVPAVRQLALFSLLSLASGFAFAVSVLPVLPWAGEPRLPSADAPQLPPARALPRRAVLLLLLIALPLSWFACTADADFSPARLGSHTNELIARSAHIREVWHVASPSLVVFRAEGAQARASVLVQAREAARRLREHGISCLSPSDLVPSTENMEQNLVRWDAWRRANRARLAERLAEASSRLGFSGGAFGPFFDFLSSEPQPADDVLLSAEGISGAASLLLYPCGDAWSAAVRVDGDNSGLRQRLASAIGSDLACRAVVIGDGGEAVSAAAVFTGERRLLPPACMLCILLLALCTRSWRRFLIVCIPPVTAVLCIYAVHRLSGFPLTLMTVLSFPIIYGLALDHGIMVSHALETGEGLGITRAVLVSSLTAFLGMGLLAFANHPALQSMGIAILSGLVGELAASLWLVPFCYRRNR